MGAIPIAEQRFRLFMETARKSREFPVATLKSWRDKTVANWKWMTDRSSMASGTNQATVGSLETGRRISKAIADSSVVALVSVASMASGGAAAAALGTAGAISGTVKYTETGSVGAATFAAGSTIVIGMLPIGATGSKQILMTLVASKAEGVTDGVQALVDGLLKPGIIDQAAKLVAAPNFRVRP